MFSFGNVSKSSAVLGLALASLFAPAALASTHPRRPLPDMLEASKIVFDGTVIGIEHRMSDVAKPGDRSLPHTFVTFRIDALVKGASEDGNTITLRFLGGPDGKGKTLTVAGMPRFQVGDRDLLFVQPEGDKLCPIVDWEHGRMRIVRGDAFTSLGSELWIAPNGAVVHGPPTLDLTSPNYSLLPAKDEKPNPEDQEFAPPAGAMRVDAQGLSAVLRHQWSVVRAVKALAEPAPTKSARMSDPLPMPFRVVRSKVATKPAAPKVDRDADDEPDR